MYEAVFTKHHTFTYHIHDDGTFVIQGIALMNNTPVTPMIVTDFVRDLLARRPIVKRIRHFETSSFAPDVVRVLTKIKKAVDLIEDAVLSPYTRIGRKRLMREFELMI